VRRPIFLLLASLFAFPQTLVQRSFVVRMATTSADPFAGLHNDCILVYPDGKYRLERSSQSFGDPSQDARIYLGRLSDASMKQLQAVLEDPSFQEIRTSEPQGGIVRDLDMLLINVPREHAIQNIFFQTANQRRPYEKTLKPLMDWMKDVEKQRIPLAKGERSDNCRAPQVLYRGGIPNQSDQAGDSDRQ